MAALNPQAEELNRIIQAKSPTVFRRTSPTSLRMAAEYVPARAKAIASESRSVPNICMS